MFCRHVVCVTFKMLIRCVSLQNDRNHDVSIEDENAGCSGLFLASSQARDDVLRKLPTEKSRLAQNKKMTDV